jgi:hypothetical protein
MDQWSNEQETPLLHNEEDEQGKISQQNVNKSQRNNLLNTKIIITLVTYLLGIAATLATVQNPQEIGIISGSIDILYAVSDYFSSFCSNI